MTALTPYLHLPGTAREALTFYARLFGGSARLHTLEEFGRTDGPPQAIAHGSLDDGPVTIFASDAVGDERSFRCDGMTFALLGAADPETLTSWFQGLARGGTVVDDLQRRPWGATDGRVVDRFGVPWLIGYEDTESAPS